MRSQQQSISASAWARHALEVVRPALALLAFGVVACADAPTSAPTSPSAPSLNRSEGRGIFQRYVALGTGMTMGWQSGGATAESQYDSWPAQLAGLAHRELDQPYIAAPTCLPPMIGPFGSLTVAASGPCANAPGVVLPTQNLGIYGATVFSALNAIVGDAALTDSGFGWSRAMPVVLAPGQTQVGAVAALNPKLASVEYGTSELLRRLLFPSPMAVVAPISPSAWVTMYDQILDATSSSSNMVVLALPWRVLPPGFVSADVVLGSLTSPEALAAFNLAAPTQPCELFFRKIYVPRFLPLVIGEALAVRASGGGPVPINCARFFRPDLSFSMDTYDVVLSAAQGMRWHMEEEAAERGFAVFDLEVLYTSYTQPPFNAITFMGSNAPFGPYVSLDGIYPTAAGNRLLAEAAARALNEQYGLGLPVSAATARITR